MTSPLSKLIDRLDLLIIPLDGNQWEAMRATGKWFRAEAMFNRLMHPPEGQCRQLPDHATLDSFIKLLLEYQAQEVQYKVEERKGEWWVMAHKYVSKRKQ